MLKKTTKLSILYLLLLNIVLCASIRVIAVLIACLKALITFKIRCDHLERFWVLWTLTFMDMKMVLKSAPQFTGILWRRRKKWSFSLSCYWGSVSGFCFSHASFSTPFSLVQHDYTLLSFKILNITFFVFFAQQLVSVQTGNIRHWPSVEANRKNLGKVCPPFFTESWWHRCAIKTCPKGLTGEQVVKQSRLWDSDWANCCVCLGLQPDSSPDCRQGHC